MKNKFDPVLLDRRIEKSKRIRLEILEEAKSKGHDMRWVVRTLSKAIREIVASDGGILAK